MTYKEIKSLSSENIADYKAGRKTQEEYFTRMGEIGKMVYVEYGAVGMWSACRYDYDMGDSVGIGNSPEKAVESFYEMEELK